MAGTATDRFDEIFSTSLLNYKKDLADNIFDAYPLFDYMTIKGKDRLQLEDSAADIILPLLYGKNTTVKSYSGYDPINTTPQEGVGNAKYPMKQVVGVVTIDRFTERQNATKVQMINLFDTKMKQLQMSFNDAISAMLFSDGTGNESKDITGLKALISATPTTGTVGGIDASTRAFWRNYQVSGTMTTTAFDNLLKRLRTAYNTCSRGRKDHIDFIIFDQTDYEAYEGLMTATINFNVGQTNLSDGDLGFENLKYKGAVTTFDKDCTAGYAYLINTDYIKFHADSQTFFEPMPFVRASNQDARTSMVLLYGELCTSNRSLLGVITAIT